ncbi:hypothetical protein AK830_g12259 [Neonectria ditissima]|uniref:Uncharacterized protein n=1 Tax=Neonectria ditissima TaxID=78410 RepID=A0A0P7B5U9_9HYPO|nr:hypothetical protein AK830_g12259 [Neonectria ditissima]
MLPGCKQADAWDSDGWIRVLHLGMRAGSATSPGKWQLGLQRVPTSPAFWGSSQLPRAPSQGQPEAPHSAAVERHSAKAVQIHQVVEEKAAWEVAPPVRPLVPSQPLVPSAVTPAHPWSSTRHAVKPSSPYHLYTPDTYPRRKDRPVRSRLCLPGIKDPTCGIYPGPTFPRLAADLNLSIPRKPPITEDIAGGA